MVMRSCVLCGVPSDRRCCPEHRGMLLLPSAPLLALVARYGDREAAELCGVAQRTMARWRAGGRLNRWMADRAAVRLGVHPSELWADW